MSLVAGALLLYRTRLVLGESASRPELQLAEFESNRFEFQLESTRQLAEFGHMAYLFDNYQ